MKTRITEKSTLIIILLKAFTVMTINKALICIEMFSFARHVNRIDQHIPECYRTGTLFPVEHYYHSAVFFLTLSWKANSSLPLWMNTIHINNIYDFYYHNQLYIVEIVAISRDPFNSTCIRPKRKKYYGLDK